MILEVAVLAVRAGDSLAFERALCQAQDIIASMPGYLSHELQRCLETQDKYVLLVRWRALNDHVIGFRQSLLHHFYQTFPTVEHYEPVFASAARQGELADMAAPLGRTRSPDGGS